MEIEVIKKVTKCRVCKASALVEVMSFGPTPLANAFLTREQVDKEEYFFPLDVYFCTSCTMLQLGHVVSPAVLFGNYVYVSSTSAIFINHFKEFCETVFPRFRLNKDSLIIDIGSNDGILLKPFKEKGARVLGIEPAKKIAEVARKEGINTVSEFFSVDLAKRILNKYGKAKIITATNVFAHIDDLDEVIRGLDILLPDDGVFIIEVPYLIDFVQKRYFDLVYHEHLSYWAIRSLIRLFRRFDMEVFDVQKVAVHGGTIRVFVKRKKAPYPIKKRIKSFLKQEKRIKLQNIETYTEYSKKVEENKIQLLSLLEKIKAKNKQIAGYGAPAKGNTLLNYFGIDKQMLKYIVDDSPWKQGLYTPGRRIPVVSSKTLYEDKVDYLLILAWNFAQPIMKAHAAFKEAGGKFIIPVPKLRVL